MNEEFNPVLGTTNEAVEQAFYDALERADIDALMACWAEEEDVVCIHPNGQRAVGINAVRRSFERVFEGGPVRIRPSAVKIQHSMMAAVHSLIEQVVVQRERGEVRINVFATNVYIKTPTGWRMVMHHASAVPDNIAPDQDSEHSPAPIFH